MNKFNKLIFASLSLLGLTVMTSCEGSTLTIEDAVANQRVMTAVTQMTTTQMDSFQIDVTADVAYSQKVYDDQLALITQRNLDASGAVHVKANNIFEDDATGSVLVSATVHAEEDSEVLVDIAAEARLYLSEGWAYADITEVAPLFALLGEEAPTVTTLKTHVGNLATAIGYDPAQPIELPFESDAIMSYMNTLKDIKATESNGELIVVYTITINDIVDVYMKVMADSGEFNPDEMTSEEIAQIRTMVLTQISGVIDITTAKFTLGVGADGFINKLYADLNVTVTVPGETGHEVHKLAGSLHIDISNVNQVVDVVLPDNLDTYTEIPEEAA